MSNLDKHRDALDALIKRGDLLWTSIRKLADPKAFESMLATIIKDEAALKQALAKVPDFRSNYQGWYSEAAHVVKQLLPDRYKDFVAFYEKPKSRRSIDHSNYCVEDLLQGIQITQGGEVLVNVTSAIPRYEQQLAILKACRQRFESSLFEIKQMVQADLFDSELGSARELLKHKYTRAAGAVAGVVLEKHLRQACENHAIKVTRKAPGISDLNDLLKQSGAYDVPQWRAIQLLGDIRNICDHSKGSEPTNDQVGTLIEGVETVIKTVF